MSRAVFLRYLLVPALLALASFAVSLRHEPVGVPSLMSHVVGAFFFYAAPFLLWGVVALLGKFSRPVWHAGLVAACIALAAIVMLSFSARDPSGLPTQWLLYWPLALVLQAVLALVSAFLFRRRSHLGA